MMKHIKSQKFITKQKGAVVLFVSIVLLIGVTLITIFAARVGVMDQRIAGNEYRHKESQAAAHAALEQASAFIETNKVIYNNTSSNWSDCAASIAIQAAFPCTLGDIEYEKVYSTLSGTIINPLSFVTPLSSGITSDSFIVFTSSLDTSGSATNILTAVGRGLSLDGTANSIEQVSYMQAFLLNPGQIPPIMASKIDINGSFTIVADPHTASDDSDYDNPLSAWVATLDGSSTGSWQTCNSNQYKNGDQECGDILNGGYDETQTSNAGWGGCSCESNMSDDDAMSVKNDILVDPDFPDDVFGYIFNGDAPETIEERAIGIKHHFANCNDLASVDLSEGALVWITGECSIPSDIGNRTNPILLVSEGLLKINGNHNVWGVLLSISDIQLSGGPIVHGSIITDSDSKLTAGGYTQVYDPQVIAGLQNPDVNSELTKVKYSWINVNN